MSMDEKQADAIARAILGPDLEAQEQLRRKRELEAATLVVRRRAASVALVGMIIGGAVGYFFFDQPTRYLIVGGVVAYWVARLVQRRSA